MKPYWHAVARSSDVRSKPLRVMFDGTPVAIFRGSTGLSALIDRCPHRQVPLSDGRVVAGEIECPYHGWRFDGGGHCTLIPGDTGPLPRYRVGSVAVTEADGGIFLSDGQPDQPPHTHPLSDFPVVARVVESTARSELLDVAENILDATHTHFTHKGLLRGLSAKRQVVQVRVTGGEDWVEASYTGEDRQDGLISRLLEGARVKTIGRFRAPGIAELEYWGPNGMVLATTFHLRQAGPDRVDGIGWLVGPRHTVLDRIKALAFVPMFRIALRQDQRVLSAARDNATLAGHPKPLTGPLDFLREDIARIMAGERPKAADDPRDHSIEL